MNKQERSNRIIELSIKQAIWTGLLKATTNPFAVFDYIFAIRCAEAQKTVIATTPIPNYIKGGIVPQSGIVEETGRELVHYKRSAEYDGLKRDINIPYTVTIRHPNTGEVDTHGDIIIPGAFKRSIEEAILSQPNPLKPL